MTTMIRINGEDQPMTVATVADLLRQEEIDPAVRGVAVAVNGVVAPKGAWETTALSAGDEIEIVKPFKGG
jgi:sulfur carrier protein